MSDKRLENVLDSSSNKRMKDMSIDRLSALPDGILIHILSFLGVRKSAVTSVLSKRWKFIWTESPILEFYDNSTESDKIRKFVTMVNRTLLIRSSSHLETFHIRFWYDESFASDVYSWLDFAVKNKAKKVCLFLSFITEEELYVLPEMMYSNSSLMDLSVLGCVMDTPTKIEWRSLTRLDIKESRITQHVIENILSGCPVLHSLCLDECIGFNFLDVKSQNLFELRVYDLEDGENGPLLEISAPYVHILDISYNPDKVKLVLKNIKSLVSAGINFTANTEEVTLSTTEELFEIFKDAKDLDLGRHYFKVLSELVVNGWQLPISKRKSLTIYTVCDDEHNISGIFALLKFSPNLERLVIEGSDHEGETWDEDGMINLDCDLLHLKKIKISEFVDPNFGGEPMLTVAQALLKRATVLEEMAIRLGIQEINDYAEIAGTLLTFPRSSGKAVIRLGL